MTNSVSPPKVNKGYVNTFMWINDNPDDGIQITKQNGNIVLLKKGDCFSFDVHVFDETGNYVYDANGKPVLAREIFEVIDFGRNLRDTEGPPAFIYYTNKEWNGFINEIHMQTDPFRIIHSITVDNCPPFNGGKSMKLKSRKNSSKKNRRITRSR
jgi:hypothetical protein